MYLSFTFFIASIYLLLNAPNNMNKSYMTMCILLALVEIAFFIISTRRKDPNELKRIILRPSYIFVFCFFIVFFQCDIDFLLGIIDETSNLVWIDTSVVSKSLAISVLALSSLICGYFAILRRKSNLTKHVRNSEIQYDTIISKNFLTLLSYLILLFYVIAVPKSYLLGGYNEGEDRGWANVLLILLQAVLAVAFALYCYTFKGNNDTKNFIKSTFFLLTLASIYIALVLITGRRTEAIRIGLMVLLSYSIICREKVNLKVLLVLFVVGSMAMSLTRVLRSGGSKDLTHGMELAMDEASFSPLTKELATSVNTLHVAVSYYPDIVPYNNGISFFSGMLVLIPGLERIVSSYIQTDSLKSSEIITTLQGTSWGMGSSIVADVYISFGIIGVIIVFFILGLFIRYLDFRAFLKSPPSPLFLVLFFCCCSQFMYACRGGVGSLFLSLSYATILVLLITRKNTKRTTLSEKF